MVFGDGEWGMICIGGVDVVFGMDLLFVVLDLFGFVLYVEICEDMFVLMLFSVEVVLVGVMVLVNLFGSLIIIGCVEDCWLFVCLVLVWCWVVYVYVVVGEGELMMDLVWDG